MVITDSEMICQPYIRNHHFFQSCSARWSLRLSTSLTTGTSRWWWRFRMAGIVANFILTTIWITLAPSKSSTHREPKEISPGCFCSHLINKNYSSNVEELRFFTLSTFFLCNVSYITYTSYIYIICIYDIYIACII